MKKTGFTLVELMGVITVLGIISLLVAPTIINQIRNSKNKIDVVTEKLIYSATSLYLDNKENEYPKYDGSTYCFTLKDLVEDGKLSSPVLDSNGDEISLDKIITVDVIDRQYNYRISASCEADRVNSLADLATTSSDLGVESIASCLTDGTKCNAGTAFAIKVNDSTTYKFYVLNDDGDKTTLIMASNLYEEGNDDPGIEWINQSDYAQAGGVDWENGDDLNNYGPITALKTLKERTADWTNIEAYSYTLEDQDEMYTAYSGEYVKNVRARLPRRSDIIGGEIGCTEWDLTCPKWIYEGFAVGGGYWLSDAVDTYSAFHVDSIGTVYDAHVYIPPIYYNVGIRPVIELFK